MGRCKSSGRQVTNIPLREDAALSNAERRRAYLLRMYPPVDGVAFRRFE